MSTMNDLAGRALLVSLRVEAWGGERTDRSVGQDILRQRGADPDAGRFVKELVPKDALTGLRRAAQGLRQAFRDRTLPWSDGTGIVPASAYLALGAALEQARVAFDREADAFTAAYPALLNGARNRLGNLFDAGDYPHPLAVRGLFSISVATFPVPSGDIRVGLSREAETRLRADMEAEIGRRSSEAMRALIERLRATVAHFQATMADPDKTFRDSTVENVRAVAEAAQGLLLAPDPELSDILGALAALGSVRPQGLRDSFTARQDATDRAAQELARLTAKMSAY